MYVPCGIPNHQSPYHLAHTMCLGFIERTSAVANVVLNCTRDEMIERYDNRIFQGRVRRLSLKNLGIG